MLKYIWEREDYFDAETRKAYFVKNIMKTWNENQQKFLENMEKEKQNGHMQISLKMSLPAMRSFLFRKRSETVQPAGRRWNVLGKNSSAMNFALAMPGEK